MRVLIATTQVPFVSGGAEILAESLLRALRAAGHEAEIVAIPFKGYPPERILDHVLACRLLDLTESSGVRVDRVIGLKFPAYLVNHPNKVMWLLHQHRTAYDLWESPMADLPHFPNGSEVRVAIQQADRSLMPEAKSFFTISRNVSHRLKKFCAVDSTPLYHPPKNAEAFRCGQAENYVFFPSRLSPIKRQALVIEALAQTRQPVRVRFAGTGDHPAYEDQLRQLAVRHQVHTRVEWMGQITEEEKIQQFAHALGVVYPPIDEDYGYVTLEAMLSSKPVITCADSGGTLEFVRQHETGLIAEPSPVSLAAALDELWENRNLAARWGATGRAYYDSMNINWTDVVRRLVS